MMEEKHSTGEMLDIKSLSNVSMEKINKNNKSIGGKSQDQNNFKTKILKNHNWKEPKIEFDNLGFKNQF